MKFLIIFAVIFFLPIISILVILKKVCELFSFFIMDV